MIDENQAPNIENLHLPYFTALETENSTSHSEREGLFYRNSFLIDMHPTRIPQLDRQDCLSLECLDPQRD